MPSLTFAEAQDRLPEFLERVEGGETVHFTVGGREVSLEPASSDTRVAPCLDERGLLAHLDAPRVLACYENAPGRELETKFLSSESSSSLSANAFGLFLDRPFDLPALPGTEDLDWPATSVVLEGIARFPWAGGRHPCLDVLIETTGSVIGVESKRYEPFRSKSAAGFADAYSRPVWGEAMKGYEAARDDIQSGRLSFRHLDAVQLIKHAFGLRTMAVASGRSATLVYLFAEPEAWADGRVISQPLHTAHRAEIERFRALVTGDEVRFEAVAYRELLDRWNDAEEPLGEHAWQVKAVFRP